MARWSGETPDRAFIGRVLFMARLEPVKHFGQPSISPRIKGWLANISQKPRASRLKENRAVISCIVHNLSRTGACLAVEGPIGIPDAFSLVFDSAEQFRTCSVMWRQQNASGPLRITYS